MYLTGLGLQDFRCFQQARLRPGSGLNVITGDNASGKTSLLEAIHILGRGHSFRSSSVPQMTRSNSCRFVINGGTTNNEGATHRIGVAGEKRRLRYKLDGAERTTRFELVTTLPLQLIDPNLHRLLEQGPRYRRHFLDWGVFHVEPHFFVAWRQYRRCLRQRNRALRNKDSNSVITAWDAELVQTAYLIDQYRQQYISKLDSQLPQRLKELLNEAAPTIEYDSGWPEKYDLETALRSSMDRDRQAGYTHYGPHRADLRIGVAGVQADKHVSRGQQKVLACALLLTQAAILQSVNDVTPILLVDDLAAELGTGYRDAVMKEIRRLGCQCFATFIEPGMVGSNQHGDAMFHVEHGSVYGSVG